MDMLKKYATLLVSFRTVFVFWTDQTKDSHKSHQLSFFCQEITFEKQIASHVKNWSSTDGCRHFLSMQLIEEDKTNILQVKKHAIPKLDVYSWPISLKSRSRVSGPWDSMRPGRLESTVWDQEGMELGGDFQAFVDLKPRWWWLTKVFLVDFCILETWEMILSKTHRKTTCPIGVKHELHISIQSSLWKFDLSDGVGRGVFLNPPKQTWVGLIPFSQPWMKSWRGRRLRRNSMEIFRFAKVGSNPTRVEKMKLEIGIPNWKKRYHPNGDSYWLAGWTPQKVS